MDSRRAAITRIATFGAVGGTLFVVVLVTGSVPTPDEARDFGERLGAWAIVAYVPLFVLANFLITWPVLAGATGLLFGTLAGFPLALTGVTVASLVQMGISRRLAGQHHGALLPERTRALEDFLTRHGAVAVMESRIVPLLPWGIVNYSAGLTRLRFGQLGLGTVVGGAPKVFAYVALGGSLGNLTSPESIVAVGLLVVLGIAGALFVRREIVAGRRARPA
jgi:uncharacterized membrane protein YdjX (TVP38/TMEM64 family)